MSKEREVDLQGNCSKCGGVHFGTGPDCVYGKPEQNRTIPPTLQTGREQPAQGEPSRRHEEWCCLDLDHKGDCKRWMKLPPNPAYPHFKEIHVQDDWCPKAGCVPATKCDIDYHHQASAPSQPSAGEKPPDKQEPFEKWARSYFGLPAKQSWQMIMNGGAGGTVVRQITIAHLAWQAALAEPASPPAPAAEDIVQPALNALDLEGLRGLAARIAARIAEIEPPVPAGGARAEQFWMDDYVHRELKRMPSTEQAYWFEFAEAYADQKVREADQQSLVDNEQLNDEITALRAEGALREIVKWCSGENQADVEGGDDAANLEATLMAVEAEARAALKSSQEEGKL